MGAVAAVGVAALGPPGMAARPMSIDAAAIIARKRESVLAETLGHYPAPLAILDCVVQGLPQQFR